MIGLVLFLIIDAFFSGVAFAGLLEHNTSDKRWMLWAGLILCSLSCVYFACKIMEGAAP